MVDLAALAATLRAEGLSYNDIGRELGFSGSHAHRLLNPEAAARNRAREAARRALRPSTAAAETVPEPTAEEVRARRAEMPDDIRGVTARLMGDPIPGDPRRGRSSAPEHAGRTPTLHKAG